MCNGYILFLCSSMVLLRGKTTRKTAVQTEKEKPGSGVLSYLMRHLRAGTKTEKPTPEENISSVVFRLLKEMCSIFLIPSFSVPQRLGGAPAERSGVRVPPVGARPFS
jgi:hypothetical protein